MSTIIPLVCTALKKSFQLGSRSLPILCGAEAGFPAGELTTIQGASGSGKSTLLQVLGGLEIPESGTVLWQGESIYAWSRNRLAAWRNLTVGFVFQAYHLFPELSALENVEFPARLAGQGNAAVGRKLLEQVGLGHRWQHRPSELSGGEQQRVALARALRNNPPLLLADEPTGNLDAVTGKEIIELLLTLQKERQLCLIIVTHDDKIAHQGQHRYRLNQGALAPAY